MVVGKRNRKSGSVGFLMRSMYTCCPYFKSTQFYADYAFARINTTVKGQPLHDAIVTPS